MRLFHLFLVLLVLASKPAAVAQQVDFNRDVRPVLSNACFQCHGPDANTREAGLRLDQRAAAIAELDSGDTAIVPENAEASELLRRVLSEDEDLRMPPSGHGDALSSDKVDTLKRWIAQGAPYAEHWAFLPAQRADPPATNNEKWVRNEIDRFVLDRLESKGLLPTREAARETLIRRVAFDLTGLPPTIEELDQFINDKSPDAYEQMVDRYLASEAYGEHMARQWLDLSRYADSNGYQYDTEREQWVWRDWVINAYNENMPFDQFTLEQIAGDLLPDAKPEQVLATGFHRNHGITIEGGIIDEEYRIEYVMDRINTVGSVWMGLTLGCARCHDHKYDPISQKEFYQLFAFFNQVPERGMRGFTPSQKIRSPLGSEQEKRLAEQIVRAEKQFNEPVDVEAKFQAWERGLLRSSWQVLTPLELRSTGGSTLSSLDDGSFLAGKANPSKDIYDVIAETDQLELTAVRLECLTHESLPGGGPGRHSNSNFVLSEFELVAESIVDPEKTKVIKFREARADYSQKGYEIGKAVDGTVAGNNGWAVDGPTRKKPAKAIFTAEEPFGFEGGTRLKFRLRHEAGFATHGIGRPRLSVTTVDPKAIRFEGAPEEILQIAKVPAKSRSEEQSDTLRKYYAENFGPKKVLKAKLVDLKKQLEGLYPATMVMQDMPKARKTHVLNRGQYDQPLEEVSPAVPAVFTAMERETPRNRLGFAKWLIDPENPLTARVAVNRYWQRIFGTGLVKTVEDFGVQGELPSHPELLDWLADEFVATGWNVKEIQKLILMSATYRQSSHAGQVAYSNDPENRNLARGPRFRLSAEEIRDSALAVSGSLVQQLGGRSVYPYQPDGLWMELNNRPGYSKAYKAGSGDDLYRRSLYTFWKRTVPSPMLVTLDAPTREFCTVARSRTNTPLQSLLLLNGPQFVEAARHLASRLIREGGDSVEKRIEYGFRLVTSRMPAEEEATLIHEVYQHQFERFSQDGEAAQSLLNIGESKLETSQTDLAELAAWTSACRLLLNLDETITKN